MPVCWFRPSRTPEEGVSASFTTRSAGGNQMKRCSFRARSGEARFLDTSSSFFAKFLILFREVCRRTPSAKHGVDARFRCVDARFRRAASHFQRGGPHEGIADRTDAPWRAGVVPRLRVARRRGHEPVPSLFPQRHVLSERPGGGAVANGPRRAICRALQPRGCPRGRASALRRVPYSLRESAEASCATAPALPRAARGRAGTARSLSPGQRPCRVSILCVFGVLFFS